MTAGLEQDNITIKLNNPKEFADTGIVGWVEMFGNSMYSIVIRPGIVIIDGAASLSPGRVRVFSKALDAAANIAESYGKLSNTSKIESR